MRSFAYLALAAAAAAGCGDSAAPTLPLDSERDASVDPDGGIFGDGSAGDGGSDGGSDGGPSPDGGLDGGLPDGGDGGMDGGAACNTSALCPSCPDPDLLCDEENPCSVGEVCLPTGCGDLARCFVIGAGACEIDADCGDPEYACNPSIKRCLRTAPGCTDSNDCVPGFACESNVCIDRRVPCQSGSDCPHGYACWFASPDQRFCRRMTRPCSDDLDCLALGVPCGDVEGDGLGECMPSLDPNSQDPVSCSNTQCTDEETPICEVTVDGTAAVCGRFGLCTSSGDCAVGFECRDLWGDARRECVLSAGSCVDSSDCVPREVCATPRAGGSPRCSAGASM